MSGAETRDFAVAAAESGVCRLLRDRLVEAITSIRSQAEITQGLALDCLGESRETGADGG
jgi:hypothetical protein